MNLHHAIVSCWFTDCHLLLMLLWSIKELCRKAEEKVHAKSFCCHPFLLSFQEIIREHVSWIPYTAFYDCRPDAETSLRQTMEQPVNAWKHQFRYKVHVCRRFSSDVLLLDRTWCWTQNFLALRGFCVPLFFKGYILWERTGEWGRSSNWANKISAQMMIMMIGQQLWLQQQARRLLLCV